MPGRFLESTRLGFRTKWTDPDFRPSPKTDRHCLMCGRDLQPAEKTRRIRAVRNTYEAIHPEDYDRAEQAIEHTIEPWFLGPKCARRLGHEWSTETGEEE